MSDETKPDDEIPAEPAADAAPETPAEAAPETAADDAPSTPPEAAPEAAPATPAETAPEGAPAPSGGIEQPPRFVAEVAPEPAGDPAPGAPAETGKPVEPAAVAPTGPEVDAQPATDPQPANDPELANDPDPADLAAPATPILRPGRWMRRAAVGGARAGAGLAAIAVGAAAVFAASALPLPGIRSTPVSTLVTPVASAEQLVCPGSLLRLSDGTGQGATTASSLGLPVLTAGGSRADAVAERADVVPFPGSQAGTGGTGGAPQLLTVPPAEPGSATGTLIAGAQSQSVVTEDFVGLATAGCVGASSETWLVGGASSVGRTTLLTLSNPSDVTAVVNLSIFGEDGAIEAPGLQGISVEPQTQSVLSLAGFAPGLESPVVLVESRGGQIVAHLQQSIVRGIDPGGIDMVAASTPPGLQSVIPGLVISGAVEIGQRMGDAGYRDLETVVRLFVPGDTAAAARVRIVPEDGLSEGLSFDLEVQPARTTDVTVGELADGSYTVIVESNVPVVAAARASTARAAEPGMVGGTTDFAWMPSTSPLAPETLLAVASGVLPSLHLANPGGADAEVILQALAGPEVVITVPAGTSISVPVASGTSYRLSGAGGLFASMTAAAQGGISGYAIAPPGASASPLLIYP